MVATIRRPFLTVYSPSPASERYETQVPKEKTAGRFRYSHYEAYDRDLVVRLLRSVFCGSSKNTYAHEIGYPIRDGIR